MKHIRPLVLLCARATRAILNHASIREFRKRFLKAIMHALVVTVG